MIVDYQNPPQPSGSSSSHEKVLAVKGSVTTNAQQKTELSSTQLNWKMQLHRVQLSDVYLALRACYLL